MNWSFNISKKGNYKALLICFFLLFHKSLFSEVIEIQSICEILPYVDSHTLVVFDIDNTLIANKQMAGGDTWFQYSIQSYLDQGFSAPEAVAKTLPDYMHLQHASEVVPVEEVTAEVVHLIQNKGASTLGLTSRSTELAYCTFKQLAAAGIDLGKSSPRCQALNLPAYFPLKYIEGILFVAHGHKGESLFKTLEEIKFPLERIVFVDDKMRYVKEVEEVCESMRIPYIGFRYGGYDQKLSEFDPAVADLQLKYLRKILSNEDAKKLLDAQRAWE